jgi:superfamily I DNA/RNA helicase
MIATAMPYAVIRGGPGTGKTDDLVARAVRAAADATPRTIVLASPWPHGARRLAARFAEQAAPVGPYIGTTLERVALDVLADAAFATGLSLDLRIVEDGAAERLFARAAKSLFALEWDDIASAAVDPEVPGLRAPDRFAAAALRLIHKLRDAAIDPDAFLDYALRGATAFYATPPNFANPSLLFATKEDYRDSLRVDAAELERQRRREIDLARVLAHVYRAYLGELTAHGVLTRADASAEAARVLTEDPALRARTRDRIAAAFVDDAQDVRAGDVRFLEALFGTELAGVTIAGDPHQATQTFAGARPERLFAGRPMQLTEASASTAIAPDILAAAAAIRDKAVPSRQLAAERVAVHRAADRASEALFVARRVAALRANGTPPERIAVLVRTLRVAGPYEDALTAANVPIAYAGDLDLLQRRDALDGIALLWTIADPFRHDHLLRALQLPTLRLSDASLALLCGEPPDPQALLFDVPGETPDANRRWDRRRDVRLATNVLRGDRDPELSADARERVQRFRAMRNAWAEARDASAGALARRAFAEAGLRTRDRSENAATHARRTTILDIVLERIDAAERRDPTRSLHDVLTVFEALAADAEPWCDSRRPGAVTVAAIDAVKGELFDHVLIADVRAGAFPPYYVPDAFLFSPKFGMIPKDNVGDARAARTAKFTWYVAHAKLVETYGKEARRLLYVGMTRARESVVVSASGRATRGASAPEFVAELEGLGIPAPRAMERPTEMLAQDDAREPQPEATHAPSAIDEATPEMPRILRAAVVERALSCVGCARAEDATAAFTEASDDAPIAFLVGRRIVIGDEATIARLRDVASEDVSAAIARFLADAPGPLCVLCDS